MKKVLVLGAGLVTRPHVRYLLAVPDFQVTVASRTVSKAEALVAGHPRGRAVALDVNDRAALEALIGQHDLSVSMLPYVYHPTVARLCIEHGKQMVTTSYVKEEMAALDGPAREAGVLLLNEIGVDPGIDHMSAMRVIHRVEGQGGRIASFKSWCGGLPAPEANDNPLGYKFSWSPKGVLLASRNAARFQQGGQIIEVPGEELFDHRWTVPIDGLGDFEGYPNRDSLPYAQTYGIQPSDWMFRGTLRYPGWCDTLQLIGRMGLLEDAPLAEPPATLREFMAGLLGVPADADLPSVLAERWELDPQAVAIANLGWLGFFSDAPLPAGKTTPLDILTAVMLSKMRYKPGERDMLIMQHEFIAEYANRQEAITATMVDYGIPHGDTSMARTVGLPAAIAARLILHGELEGLVGVHVPVLPEIYNPVLDELESLGIGLKEKVGKLGNW